MCQTRPQYFRLVGHNLLGPLENQCWPSGVSGYTVNEMATETDRCWKYVNDIITVGESCNPEHPLLLLDCRTVSAAGRQDCMDHICTRAAADHMTLNVEKCTVMQCSLASEFHLRHMQVSANGKTVPIVNSMTLLGITLSPSLK